MSPKFSIVAGYKNRDVTRVERLLKSLAVQTNTQFELIIVDYGSDMSFLLDLRILINKYPFAKLIEHAGQGHFWNRAHALNIGFRNASADTIITTDIDLIFNSDFIENCLKKCSDVNTAYYYKCWYLEEKYNDWGNEEKLNKSKLELSNDLGFGLSVISKSRLFEINGYDEYYRIYGTEDLDIHKRLKLAGLTFQWLNPNEIYTFHQWHPINMRNTKIFPQGWNETFDEYFRNNETIKRNDENWGKLIKPNERSALTALQLMLEPIENKKYVMHQTAHIYSSVLNLNKGESVFIRYIDKQFQHLNYSRKAIWREKTNNWLKKRKLPFRLELLGKFEGYYYSVTDLWGILFYLILENQGNIDYHLTLKDNTIECVFSKSDI